MAVLEPLQYLAKKGFEVELAPVTSGGYVEPETLRGLLRPDTLLVSVMHANNETGVLQPVHEIAALVRGTDTLFHTDAAQTFGKEVPSLRELQADLVSISGHKIYGPQGIGALVVRRREPLVKRLVQPLHFGGGQERGLRPGTLPVALAVGLGEAAHLAGLEWLARRATALAVREQLLRDLQTVDHRVNGDQARCLPHVLNVSFLGIDSEAFLMATRDTIAVSNGSACTSTSYKSSHVLLAMGLSDDRIESAIRISWGLSTAIFPGKSLVAAIRSIIA
jgi:cysteine desulfurase